MELSCNTFLAVYSYHQFFIEFYSFIFKFKFTIIRIKPLNDLLEDLAFDADEGDIGYHLQPKVFEKIRRITEHLVKTIDRFNNRKWQRNMITRNMLSSDCYFFVRIR